MASLFLCSTIFMLLAVAGVTFFLHKNPQALAMRLAREVQERTAATCSLGMVDVIFFPMPALAISDVHLQNDTMDVRVAYATLRPALWPLLRGVFEPGNVHLLRPQILVRLETGQKEQQHSFKSLLNVLSSSLAPQPHLPPTLYGAQFQVQHGSLEVQQQEGRRWILESVNASASVSPSGSLSGTISLGPAALYAQDTLLGSVDALQAKVWDWAAPEQASARPRLEVGTRLHIPHYLQSTDLSFTLALNSAHSGAEAGSPLRAQWRSNGALLWQGTALPFSLKGTAESQGVHSFRLHQVHLGLDKDSMSLEALLQMADAEGPRLTGSMNIQRLSLPQWFGFARPMPSGLQRTLDELQGTLNFVLTKDGLQVPSIKVQAADGLFTGTGSVPTWWSPTITLNLKAPSLTLDKALPEAAGQAPAPLLFAHPPLTPVPGSAEAKAMPGPSINYDINLNVQGLKVWNLDITEAGFLCVPAPQAIPQGGPYSPGPLMQFTVGQAYGGKGKGQLQLYSLPDQQTGYAISAQLHNISLEQALTRLHGKTPTTGMSGRLSLNTNFTAKGRTMAAFLASQEGKITVQVDNGHILSSAGKEANIPFHHLILEGKAASLPPPTGHKTRLPAELSYTGQWKAHLRTPDSNESFQMEGPFLFTGKNFSTLQIRKAPGHLSVQMDKKASAWMQKFKAEVSGRFSLHSGLNSVGIEDAEATLPSLGDLHFKGQAQASFDGKKGHMSQWSAKGSAEAGDVPLLLRTLWPEHKASLPAGLPQKARAEGDIQQKDKSLTASGLKLLLGQSTVSGSASGHWAARPTWKFDLTADKLDLDTYLPPQKGTKKGGGSPWNLQWLKDNDAQGSLRIGHLRLRQFSLHKAHFPLQMRGGTLHCPQGRGELYGAEAKLSFKGEATPTGLALQTALEAQGMNVLSMSEDRKMRTALGGKGNIWIRVQGTAARSADIPAALNGGWRFHLSEGFMQDMNTQGKLVGTRTYLTSMQGAGSMEKGVLRSDVLTMQGPTLNVNGKGWVNLNTDTLDVDLMVDMRNLPTIPVRFHGSLDKPERSISAGAALLGTLGGLGSGLMDLLGGVLGGIIKLF